MDVTVQRVDCRPRQLGGPLGDQGPRPQADQVFRQGQGRIVEAEPGCLGRSLFSLLQAAGSQQDRLGVEQTDAVRVLV